VKGKNPLYANPVRDIAHGEGGTCPIVHPLDADALINLDALFVALDNFDVHPQGVPRLENRDVFF
jgi:hypothetical protein